MGSVSFLYRISFMLCLMILRTSGKHRCADSECQVAISEAEAILNFSPDVENKVSFKKGDKVVVYSKSDGSLWGVEVNGERGFAPKVFLKETRTFFKDLKHSMPEESASDSVINRNVVPTKSSEFLTSNSVEVVDGSTVYSNSTYDLLDVKDSTSFIRGSDALSKSSQDNTVVQEETENVFSVKETKYLIHRNENEYGSLKTDEILKQGLQRDELKDNNDNSQLIDEIDRNDERDENYKYKENIKKSCSKRSLFFRDEYAESEDGELDTELYSVTKPDRTNERGISVKANWNSDSNLRDGKLSFSPPLPVLEKEEIVNSAPREEKISQQEAVNQTEVKDVLTSHEANENIVIEEVKTNHDSSDEDTSVKPKFFHVQHNNQQKYNSPKETYPDILETTKQQLLEESQYISRTAPDENRELDSTFDRKSETLNERNEGISGYEHTDSSLNNLNSGSFVSDSWKDTTTAEWLSSEENDVEDTVVPESDFDKSLENFGEVNDLNNGDQRHAEQEQSNTDHSAVSDLEAHLEVQGECDIQSSDCAVSSELPEKLSSTGNTWQEWFSALIQVSPFESEFISLVRKDDLLTNSMGTLWYLMITGVTVVMFLLGYYYIEKQRHDNSLIAKLNSLGKAIMLLSQENFLLKEELGNVKDKASNACCENAESTKANSALKEELDECKSSRLDLEEQVASLEKELESATEAGLELNKMMSDLLSTQHGSDTLMRSVEHLQKQLDNQQSTISAMNACLTAKSLENENLQSELTLSSERVISLEEQIAKVNETMASLKKEKLDVERDFKVKNQSIEKQLVEALENKSADSERLQLEVEALQNELDECRRILAAKEEETSVLKECLACVGESKTSVQNLIDVGYLKAELDSVSKERDDLKEKLVGEEEARKLLEDHMKIVSEEVVALRAKYEEADYGKMEAQTRLEVLSNYFKEKETQLQKELGLKEAMYIQKEGDALVTVEQIKAFQEEIESYKAQNEILKKEILDQERSMKSQIASLEKKFHENWVAARQMERRLEESKQESSQLRNRLTLSGRRFVGNMPGHEFGKSPVRELEYDGMMPSSPAHLGEKQDMMSSPLHFKHPSSSPLLPSSGQQLPPDHFPSMPPFLPPPNAVFPFPIPPPASMFYDDLRPPPLGRMSSPPPEPHSFSHFDNSPPHSRSYVSSTHYEDSPSMYHHSQPSSGSLTSPYSSGKLDDCSESPRSSHRLAQRDSPRETKGLNINSGLSSESLDEGGRNSSRV